MLEGSGAGDRNLLAVLPSILITLGDDVLVILSVFHDLGKAVGVRVWEVHLDVPGAISDISHEFLNLCIGMVCKY